MKKLAPCDRNRVFRSIKGMAFTLIMFWACQINGQVQFPVDVGVKPESITKGFNGNYYVTLMNGKDKGDGEVAEISESGVRSLQKVLMNPRASYF
ncbi:hypothetical protein Q2T40_00970 [Winogradskyella maritima]|nr:hypothetical protein [Winogradskyella maritima]